MWSWPCSAGTKFLIEREPSELTPDKLRITDTGLILLLYPICNALGTRETLQRFRQISVVP